MAELKQNYVVSPPQKIPNMLRYVLQTGYLLACTEVEVWQSDLIVFL